MYYTNKSIDPDNGISLNKTRMYLVQQLQHYGEDFISHVSKNAIIVFALQDFGFNVTEDSRKLESHLYMLFDTNGKSKAGNYINVASSRIVFSQSLMYYQSHPAYVTDYCYDSNRTGHYHVIVVKLPFPEKLDLFLQGTYSKLYSQKQLDDWFIKEIQVKIVDGETIKTSKKLTDQWSVLTKDPSYVSTFINQVKEEFNTNLNPADVTAMEFDFKPSLNQEILRYGFPTISTRSVANMQSYANTD
jgi:hypothetical protein